MMRRYGGQDLDETAIGCSAPRSDL